MYKSFSLGIIITAAIWRSCNSKTINPEISTPSGYTFVGKSDNFNGEEISVFLNVPYAEPPIGELRFRPSVMKESTSDINTTVDASTASPPCLSKEDNTIEDCLILNIWTPKNFQEKEKLPVLVYIHGGGFIGNFANPQRYNGKSFASKDIILVSIQFRNHWLGNFNLNPVFGRKEVKDQDENLALDDQRVALKWIQKNIPAFGGNPNDVTILGFSSGAGFVMAHMASKESESLFHKAIIQSGSHLISSTLSYLTSWYVMLRVLLPIERKYKCGSSSILNFDCLGRVGLFQADMKWWQNVSSDIIKEALIEIDAVIPDTIGSIGTGIGSSVPDVPSRVLKNSDISSNIPLLIGLTMDEGYYLYPFFSSFPGLNASDPDCGSWSSITEFFAPTLKATDIIKEDPTNTDQPERRENWTKERAAFSIVDELLFGIPTQAMLEAHKGPKYAYIYENPFFDGYECKGTGTPHGAESFSIFGVDLRWFDMPEIHDIYVNFVKTGSPGSVSIFDKSFDWKEYDINGEGFTMIVSEDLRTSNNPFLPERERIANLLLQECLLFTPIGAPFLRPVCKYNPTISFFADMVSALSF